ncbi:MAG: TetR family transcriptional regulator [Oscillospiraceae bacterium]|nr:TetR family transcriptional regulator [Oscillospiraceae bacterium]
MTEKNANLRESLILAGIAEVNTHGVSGFSIRRVAESCGVSCAAPYRHFANKRDLIAAIIDYVNDQWAQRQEEVLAACPADYGLRQKIIEISLSYIRFLMEKPHYRAVLMLKDEAFDNLYHKKRTQFRSLSQSMEAQLFATSGLPADVWKRKLMVFRSLIFGAVFLFDAGEFEYNDTTMEYLRFTLDREFNIF